MKLNFSPYGNKCVEMLEIKVLRKICRSRESKCQENGDNFIMTLRSMYKLVAGMGEIASAYKISEGKPDRNTPLGRPMHGFNIILKFFSKKCVMRI
jgi:hypothetical protein